MDGGGGLDFVEGGGFGDAGGELFLLVFEGLVLELGLLEGVAFLGAGICEAEKGDYENDDHCGEGANEQAHGIMCFGAKGCFWL